MTQPVAEGRREKRKRELRARIYDVAIDLFRSQGFEQTTVGQIAEAADIAPATFFNHFQNKNALLGQMTAQVLDTLETMLEEEFEAADSTHDRLTGFVARAAESIAETRGLARDVLLELVRAEYEPGGQLPYVARIHDPIVTLVRSGQSRGEVRSDQDASFLAEMVVGMLNATITNWLSDPDYPIEQRLRQAAEFAWQAIQRQDTPGSLADPIKTRS